MNPAALHAWTALYLAVGIMAAMCALLSTGVTAYEVATAKWRPRLGSGLDRLLAAPRLWLRWQRNYFLGFPTIIAVALMFAHDLGFAVLGAV